MIISERLTIKPLCSDDASALLEGIQNNKEHLQDYFPVLVKQIDSLEQASIFIQNKQEGWAEKKNCSCGIFLKESNKLIGYISIREIDWSIPKGELGYFIFQSYMGKGYAKEALSAFCNFFIDEWNFVRLYARIAPDNYSSLKTAEHCGFVKEGLLRNEYRKAGVELTDIVILGRLADANG